MPEYLTSSGGNTMWTVANSGQILNYRTAAPATTTRNSARIIQEASSAALSSEQMERLLREAAIRRDLEEEQFEEEFPFESPNKQAKNLSLEDRLKIKHLNRKERRMLHNPASDWKESEHGDVCRSACTLEVKDILDKIK